MADESWPRANGHALSIRMLVDQLLSECLCSVAFDESSGVTYDPYAMGEAIVNHALGMKADLVHVVEQRNRLRDEIRGSYGDEHDDHQIEDWATRLHPGDLTDGAHDDGEGVSGEA